MRMPRIAVADNDRFALEMLTRTIGRALPSSTVIWVATSGERAVHQCLYGTTPDLLLLDMSLGGEPDGVEACRQIREHDMCPTILAITSYSPKHYRDAAISAGAQGLIGKAVTPKELVDTIRMMIEGEVMPGFMSAAIAHELLVASRVKTSVLSQREREVLRLYADRLSTEEIAQRLGIKASTVFVIMRHAKLKLGAHSREEAIRAFLGLW